MKYLNLKILTVFVVLPIALWAQYDLPSFVKKGLQTDGRLAEKRFEEKLDQLKVHSVLNSAILPRFEVSTAFGPAPGLRDESSTRIVGTDTIVEVAQKYDFSKLGPYWGTEIKMAQPLNVFRLLAGLKAARAGVRVRKAEIRKKEIEISVELEDIYWGMVLAQDMLRLAKKAEKELGKASDKMEEMLDDEEEGVSQDDFLELKTKKYDIKKAVLDAETGVARARLGALFSLNLADTAKVQIADSIMLPRKEALPSLESLKKVLLQKSPDLQQLHNGLIANKELLKISEAEMGPDFFVFGTFSYAKAWAGERGGLADNVFTQDPLNRIDGSLGIGMKFHLNVWSRKDNVLKRRLELSLLQRKDAYAAKGLILQLEEQYQKVLAAKELVNAAETSMRASEALFKGAAMKYDLDNSKGRQLMTAFSRKLSASKNYAFSAYDYNRQFSRLLAKVGWTLPDFYNNLKKNQSAE